MLRLDNEKVTDLSKSDEAKLLYAFENYLAAESPHVVVMEDYNKGILTPRVIRKIISLCKKHHIITAADPKRKNFFSYAGVDIFKPNLKEVKDGLNLLAEDINLEILKT
jgi:bifunctional ADP-heptose synthase (sugar kinase/adenylyltransferase)